MNQKLISLLGLVLLFNTVSKSQITDNDSGKKNFTAWLDKKPIETITAVAQQVIAVTPFTYNLQLDKPAEKFDFIKLIDFGRTFGLGKPAVAIALSEIQVLKDTSITLEISHNDGVLVLINGREVFQSTGLKEFKAIARERNIELMSTFSVNLKRGQNRIVIKSETNGKEWLVYLQPKDATIEFSPVQNINLGLSRLSGIDPSVSQLSNWLVCGPFQPKQNGLLENYGPENEFDIGKMYEGQTGQTTWTIPKVEVLTNVKNPHPLWGTLYNYNYHTAGLAWAMAHLGKTYGNKSFVDYALRYCDFMLDARPMVNYQYNQLHGFRSVQHHLVNTPLLDFTAAPTLPYAYLLAGNFQISRKEEYSKRVEEIKTYLAREQVRLPDGTFTRETPEKMTTWVDDMFMGIPFLVHAGLAAASKTEKANYLNEAAKQVLGFNKQVFDIKANLYHHASYSTKPSNIPYWSRANGWGIFATSIVLQNLPKSHPDYKPIMKFYKSHAEKLVSLQDKSGFWHQILNDTTAYLETSGTAIFTMAIARGLNEGWLKGEKYEKAALQGWKAIASQINEKGDVFNICIGTMSSEDPNYYKTRPLVKSDSHGLIGVFWAAMEVQKYLDARAKK